MGYKKNTWTVYDQTVPDIKQPNSFITKAKLDHIENGIEDAVTDIQLGTVTKGLEYKCEIVPDEKDDTIKRLNITFKKEVSWIYSSQELFDKQVAPLGCAPEDYVLDSKGNIFTVIINQDDQQYRLEKKINIKGATGLQGPAGPQGISGLDGKDGKDGKDANKWIYADKNIVEGEGAPEEADPGDFVLDDEGDIFEVLEDMTCHKLLNIKGASGKDATGDFKLTIGEVTIGDTASAEITSDNKLNLTIPKGDTGAAGLPGADGIPGERGEKGDKGDNGKDGVNGVGITNIIAELESDGKTIKFTFALDDGSSKTAAVTLP